MSKRLRSNKKKKLQIRSQELITDASFKSETHYIQTKRTVDQVIDGIRNSLEPYIGQTMHPAFKAAAHVAVEKVLLNAKRLGFINNFNMTDVKIQDNVATAEVTIQPTVTFHSVNLQISIGDKE